MALHFLFTSYYYLGWPFDNVCKTDATPNAAQVEELGVLANITLNGVDVFGACDQSPFYTLFGPPSELEHLSEELGLIGGRERGPLVFVFAHRSHQCP